MRLVGSKAVPIEKGGAGLPAKRRHRHAEVWDVRLAIGRPNARRRDKHGVAEKSQNRADCRRTGPHRVESEPGRWSGGLLSGIRATLAESDSNAGRTRYCHGSVNGCYLLHFDRPVYGAQHYLGWSTNITARVAKHQRGRGARLVAQALAAGIWVALVRVWPEVDRAKERSLKRSGPKAYCPTCRRGSAQAAAKNAKRSEGARSPDHKFGRTGTPDG